MLRQHTETMFEITDLQKIGVGLAGFGIAFLFLGVLMIFDKGLLAIGNVSSFFFQGEKPLNWEKFPFQILFISGLGCVIGPERTFRFFFQRHKARASVAFFGGIAVVLLGYPIIGMVLESYGFFLLFSGFFPVAVNFLRRVPVLGQILNAPGISRLVDRIAGDSNRTTVWGVRDFVNFTFNFSS